MWVCKSVRVNIFHFKDTEECILFLLSIFICNRMYYEDTDLLTLKIKTKQVTTNATLFNVWRYAMLQVSIPKKSSPSNSYKKF